jgi:hypothetical protein
MLHIISLFMLGLLHGVRFVVNGKISGRLVDEESGVPVAGVSRSSPGRIPNQNTQRLDASVNFMVALLSGRNLT